MSVGGPVDLETGWVATSLRADVRRLVLTLLRVFGPLGGPSRGVPDVPDGYGDIDVRGPLERLLISEWALMLDWPEEFDRRAVSGEQLHLMLEHARRPTRRDTVALFDAGPDQLGAPRAVHVAVWLALHARARLGAGGFRWGVLQEPEAGLTRKVGPRGGERLLEARTVRRPSRGHVVRWEELLDPHQDEVWVVGGQGRHLRHATEVGVTSTEREGLTSFEVTHRGSGGTARTVQASLGTSVVRALLTRGFAAPPDAPRSGRTAPQPRIGTEPSLDRLHVVRQDRVDVFVPRAAALGAWHLEPVGSLEVEDDVVAVGSWSGAPYALLRRGDHWRLRGSHPANGREGEIARLGIEPSELRAAEATGQVGVMVTWGSHVHVRLTSGRVLRFDPEGQAEQVPGRALHLFADSEGLWRVEADALGRLRCVRVRVQDGETGRPVGQAPGEGLRVVEGVAGAIGVLQEAQSEGAERRGRVFAGRGALNRAEQRGGSPLAPTFLVVGAQGPRQTAQASVAPAWLALRRVQGELWRVPVEGEPVRLHTTARALVAGACAWSVPALALLDVEGDVTLCGLQEA